MLQVKREEAPTVNVENEEAVLLERRSCISQNLLAANHKARAKKSDECKAVGSEGKTCKNHDIDGKCTLPLDQGDIAYRGGNPQEHLFCDVGQYSACKAWQHSGMDQQWTAPADSACEVGGFPGKCKQAMSTGA